MTFNVREFVDYCDEMMIAKEGFFDRFKKKKDGMVLPVKPQINIVPWNDMTSEQKNELDRNGRRLVDAMVKHLKEYIKKQDFNKRYRHSVYSYKRCCEIEPWDELGGGEFGIQISNEQEGISSKGLDEYCRKHPEFDYVKDDYYKLQEFDTGWYDELLKREVDVLPIAKKLGLDEKYHITTGTGDGDEGLIYITLQLLK